MMNFTNLSEQLCLLFAWKLILRGKRGESAAHVLSQITSAYDSPPTCCQSATEVNCGVVIPSHVNRPQVAITSLHVYGIRH